MKLGVSFIDTADYYENAPAYGDTINRQGGSETVIALALKHDPSLEGFVATKISMPPHSAERIRIKCGESLRNLQLDTIPLYQLHIYDKSTPIQERMGALKALQDEGLIQYIGLNNTTVEQLEEAWATGVRFHTLQIRYSMFSRRYVETHILPWCAAHGVGILAHSVLGKGLLSGRYQPGHVFADNDERSNFVDFHGENFERFCHAVSQLKVIADRKSATMTELVTGWVLRRPEVSVALVGGKSPEQVEANTRFVNDFSEQDLAEIEAILEDTPEISRGITIGGCDTSLNNDARAKVGLPPL